MTRLHDPHFYIEDPDTEFARLRHEDPVHWYAEGGFWALFRHADVLAVSRDPQRFKNGAGVLMQDRNREVAAADSLLYLDPPVHSRYRKIVSTQFTPRAVTSLEDRVRAMTHEVLAELDPRTEIDLVDTVTSTLPMLVIAELLGVPREDRNRFRFWSDAIMEAATDLTPESALPAMELLVYFGEQVAARRERGGGDAQRDLLGRLMAAEVDGERLTDQELLGFCMTLLVAGNETTRNLLSGGLVALAEHPEQRAALVADPTLIPRAVEEMLRWVSPIMLFARTATTDTEIAGRRVAEGDFVVMYYVSANRDEAVFGPTAGTFDIGRDPNPHLAFGFGEHFCLGAGLARLEARVVLEELLARWPAYRLATPDRVPSTLLRGIAKLPAVLDPAG